MMDHEVTDAKQREIRKRVDDIGATIEMHENAIDELRLTLNQIRRSCKHPNKYPYSASGELGVRCPDCGWST